MKVIKLILISILGISGNLSAQNWLQGAGGNSQDEAMAITIDNQSNIITTGYFSQSARFDNFIIGSGGMGDVFIAKQNSNGEYLWVTKAGGLYSDRGFGITTNQNNEIFITGVFKGAATFGSTILISNGNSQDAFVAKLDANGNFIWAVSLGGNDTEIANDIEVNSLGEIFITGQYKDTAQFGSFNLISAAYDASMGSLAGLPSYDGFLVKINDLGNVLWAKNISGDYDDRAMKLAIDNADNVYISGQFSDTLYTGNIYNNNSYNAAFLLKTDANGNDIWFRRLLAPQIMIYDIKTDGTDIFLTGDAKGNINISTTPATVVSANAGDFNIYVLKINNNGNVIWNATQNSENNLSSRAIALSPNGDVTISGFYNCSFTQMTNMFQPALFNSVGYKDIYVLNYNAQGTRIWERNYGGIGEDWVWGMEMLSNNHPILAGSYANSFSMPFGSNFIFYDSSEDISSEHSNNGLMICGNSNYGNYVNAIGKGNKDILTCDPINLALPHFDYYNRINGNCILDTLMPDLYPLGDTLTACDSIELFIRTNTSVNYKSAPAWEFLWSTNSIDDTITVTSTGWYFIEYGFPDDCRRFKDSVFVEIYQSPFFPSVTCSNFPIVEAIPHDGCYNKLAKMVNDTAYLSASNLYPGYDFYWVDAFGNIILDTNIIAVDFGVYSLVVTSPNGMCSRSQCVKVYDYMIGNCPGAMNGTMVPMLVLTDSNYNDTDTVIVCINDFFGVELYDSVDFYNGQQTLINTFVEWTIIQGGFTYNFSNSANYTFGTHHEEFLALSSGNCTLKADILHPITLQSLMSTTRNFYLNVRQPPPNNPIISGPNTFCPGDTILLTVNGGDEYIWGGPGIVATNLPVNDSIWITMEGDYFLQSTTRDTILNCPDEVELLYPISSPAAPPVIMTPYHGVICPNDSVLLSAEPGSGYEWYGPTGSVISTSASVWVTVPGFYYYTFTTTGGCELISDMAEVREYSTPFLEADPGTNLCIGGSLTITVESNELSLVNWSAPLSGNAFSQTIYSSGIYQASVSFCNITTVVDIEITQSILNAEIIYNGNDTICSSDEIVLIADGAGATVTWLPENVSGTIYIPTEPGTYILELSDQSGCTDYDTLQLNYFPAIDSPIANDTNICGGSTITIFAQSSFDIYWFDSMDYNNSIGAGDSLNVMVQNQDSVFYVASFDGNCYSAFAELEVNLFPSSVLPTIYGDSILCLNDSLILFTDLIPGLSYLWNGPNGFVDSTDAILIPNADLNNAGFYSLFVYDSVCQSNPQSFEVQFSIPQLQGFSSLNFNLCSGDTLILSDTLIGNYTWQNGNILDSFLVDTSGIYYFSFENNFGCQVNSDTISVLFNSLPVISSIADTAVCFGSPLIIIGNANNEAQINWEDSDISFSSIGDTLNLNGVSSPMNLVVFATDSLGCQSISDSLFIDILPNEAAPTIFSSDTICELADLILIANSSTSTQFIWNGPNNYSSTIAIDTLENVSLNYSGTYSVYTTNGYCNSDTSTIEIFVYPLPELMIDNDGSICLGDSITLSVTASEDFYWNDFSTGNTLIVSPDSSQWYYVITESYCGNIYDSVFITVHPLPIVNLGTDQTILLGLGVQLNGPNDADYNWNPSLGLDCNNCASVYASPTDETTYTLIVTDTNGCISSDTITIFVQNVTTCFIPNSFTPNGDGINDFFSPQIYGLENYHILIFDRWGEMIFESNISNQGWDGTHKGKPVQDGTYIYIITGSDLDGEAKEWRGHLNVMR